MLTLLWLAVFIIRLLGPPNLMDQDQERPASYVLDAVQNGNWICQRDYAGNITSKPPLWTWLAASFTLLCGQANLFTLYLPGALAMLGTMLMVFVFGQNHFGFRAGFFAAIALILCSAGSKWTGLARTDGVFTLTITAAAFLAWRAWHRGSGWTWFWLLAAAITLTKGPLGIVLAATGLFARLWERKKPDTPGLKGSHWLGIALFFLIAGGWFALAYYQEGRDLVQKMIGKELVGHIAHDQKGRLPGRLLWQPPIFYLTNDAPWSLLAYFGGWRIWKFPAQNSNERRLERFLFCWFSISLVLFSLSPHQRADLLWPLMPPGALMAGRELSRLTRRFSTVRVWTVFAVILAGGIAGICFYFFHLRAQQRLVQQTMAVKRLAAELERKVGKNFPLAHMDSPMAFQLYLNTMHRQISSEQAAELLRGTNAAFVALINPGDLETARRPDDPPMFTLLPPPDQLKQFPVRIVSNRPDFVVTNGLAFPSESIK